MSIFRQSPTHGIHSPTCRNCGAPAEPGSDVCAYHGSEAYRLARQPQRAGYRDPAYWRARRKALRRANGKCEACGSALQRLPNGRPQFQTHHIDGDPRNNDPANLLVCCSRCHSGGRRPA